MLYFIILFIFLYGMIFVYFLKFEKFLFVLMYICISCWFILFLCYVDKMKIEWGFFLMIVILRMIYCFFCVRNILYVIFFLFDILCYIWSVIFLIIVIIYIDVWYDWYIFKCILIIDWFICLKVDCMVIFKYLFNLDV